MKAIKRITVLALVLVLALSSVVLANGATYTENWDGRGTDSMRCSYVGQEGRPETGWIHWVFNTKGDSTGAELVLGGTGSGTFAPGEPLNANIWHFYTPYFELEGLTATINLFGGNPGPGGGLVISDYCPGELTEHLTVTKTAVTSFTRTHDWDIAKKVETENGFEHNGLPKIWLYTDGRFDETATWTVDVTYEGYNDSNWNVSGTITVENTGSLDAVITSVDDILAGNAISVDLGSITLPYTLAVGETVEFTYSEDGYVEGTNEVSVTTERDEYFGDADILWGDPTSELYATVNVKDISDLFGEVSLGSVSAPNDAQFTYTKDFAYADLAECGDFRYDNEAIIVETGQSADASLLVNVQCLIFRGETAWAANGKVAGQLRYTSRGNWATYVAYAGVEKTTTLFAGQTMAAGTVTFSAPVGGFVTITIALSGDWEFADIVNNIMVQDYASAPSGNPSPGLFAHKATGTEQGGSIVVPVNNFYGVHANVGIWVPDPNFGPEA